MHPLATILLFLVGASMPAGESSAIAKMASCEDVVCLKDAYFTPHLVSAGTRVFYEARLLQMIPRNRATETALLDTLPKTAGEADSVLSFTCVPIDDDDDRKLRDGISRDLIDIYERAARRHPEYTERLIAAEPLLREAVIRLSLRTSA